MFGFSAIGLKPVSTDKSIFCLEMSLLFLADLDLFEVGLKGTNPVSIGCLFWVDVSEALGGGIVDFFQIFGWILLQ